MTLITVKSPAAEEFRRELNTQGLETDTKKHLNSVMEVNVD